MSALVKLLVAVLTMTPFLFLADCVYREISLARSLQRLCTSTEPRAPLAEVLEKAREHEMEVRTGGLTGLDESEWFDREYARIVAWRHEDKEIPADITVVFSKPGMGYYACVIEHERQAVLSAEFVDRSS